MDTDNMYIALYDEASDMVRFGLAYVDRKRVDIRNEDAWKSPKAGKGRTEEIIQTRNPILHLTKEEGQK